MWEEGIEMAKTAYALEEAIERGDTGRIIELGELLAREVKDEVSSQAEAGGWYEEYDRATSADGWELETTVDPYGPVAFPMRVSPVKKEQPYIITKDMVREGIEQGVIRFVANPDSSDPWKTMCCVGEEGGLFYFVDTTDMPPEEYVRMNQNNLDMVVDDVWEALNGDILRDFADDYERYADLLREPRHGGRSSLDATSLHSAERVAVGVGYMFNILDAQAVANAGASLKATGTVVTVDGRDYRLMKGATYEDSRKVDVLLDTYGQHRVKDFSKDNRPPLEETGSRSASLSDVERDNRASAEALSGREPTNQGALRDR